MPATIHPSSVLIACPTCKRPMTWLGELAWCDSTECDDQGKQYRVELPSVDVKLTPVDA